jgi:hydrogenase large subunit
MAKITLSPVTRISGLLSVDVFTEAGGIVREANCAGEQFRGFELMMKGRKVKDAVYFTQRICGICSMAHGFTAANLVRRIYGVNLRKEASILQQILLGAEFLQNHIRHFYLLALPDYLDSQFLSAAYSKKIASRFSPTEQQRLAEHYFSAMDHSAKCHEMLAIFGGKIPHQHGLVAEGLALAPNAGNRLQFLSLLTEVHGFIREIMLPDIYLLAEAYPDYLEIGTGVTRFISFGLFDPRFGGHFPAGIIDNHVLHPVLAEEIHESITHAWYRQADSSQVLPDPEKASAYTWVKAPRYNALSFEGGPLARKAVRAYPQPLLRIGTMARLIARAEEADQIAGWITEWMNDLPEQGTYIQELKTPQQPEAVQINDAPRGPLLHRITANNDDIVSYDVITPTTWNFSPKDENGVRGPVEEALVGTKINNLEDPVEIGRIVRSYDPCLSCATHLIDLEGKKGVQVEFVP